MESYGRWSSFLRAVGRSSFPKYFLRVGDRNTITVLPTILSKISVILFDEIWHISFFSPSQSKSSSSILGEKVRTLSLFPFYLFFPPPSFHFVWDRMEEKNFCKSLLCLAIYLGKLDVWKFQFIYVFLARIVSHICRSKKAKQIK